MTSLTSSTPPTTTSQRSARATWLENTTLKVAVESLIDTHFHKTKGTDYNCARVPPLPVPTPSHAVAARRGRVAALSRLCRDSSRLCRGSLRPRRGSVATRRGRVAAVAQLSRGCRAVSRWCRGVSPVCCKKIARRRASVAGCRGVLPVSRAVFFLSKPRHVPRHPSEGGVSRWLRAVAASARPRRRAAAYARGE